MSGCAGGSLPEPCDRTPAAPSHINRPGRSSIEYRIGNQPEFLQRMLARLGSQTLPDGDLAGGRPLADLTTRQIDDPTVALLDAWATTCDVLTFYQERIANEGFLRTATERRSVLELARAIGYELSPGVAASVNLAFVVDDSDGPAEAIVEAGTPVQSVPAPGELPQVFETDEELTAQTAWNELRPRALRPQIISSDTSEIWLDGAATRLEAGDRLLLVQGDAASAADGGWTARAVRITAVEADAAEERTRVTVADLAQEGGLSLRLLPATATVATRGTPSTSITPMTGEAVIHQVLEQSWTSQGLWAHGTLQGWDSTVLTQFVNQQLRSLESSSDTKVFALRDTLGMFGNNAPTYATLEGDGEEGDGSGDWDALNGGQGPDIWRDSSDDAWEDVDVYLERPADAWEDGWVLLEGRATAESASTSSRQHAVYRVTEASRASPTDFGLSTKCTGLRLAGADGDEPDRDQRFLTRKTTAHVASEELAVTGIPEPDEIPAATTEMVLDSLVLDLEAGQVLVLRGERYDMLSDDPDVEGVVGVEEVTLKEVRHESGYTVLVFEEGLEWPYLRSSVTLNANVVAASHGQTIEEVLGSGDATLAGQRFALRRNPLTHVRSTTPSGRASTLELRVDEVAWNEEASLYAKAAADQIFVTRLDDDGVTHVQFGDGVRGARLPSGRENITAVYRTGIGTDGEVAAESLTLLPQRPAGIRSVVNPLAADDAADPEELADARTNAPRTVLTLDRVVSVRDYQDFANAFPGIAKAQATRVWDGHDDIVLLTVCGDDGDAIESGSTTYETLVAAIGAARDPGPRFQVASYAARWFNLDAGIVIDPAYDVATVLADAKAAVEDEFSFDNRRLAQQVSAAEVVAALHGVSGVVAVDVDQFYRVETLDAGTPALDAVLPARSGHWNAGAQAAELVIASPVGINLYEKEEPA